MRCFIGLLGVGLSLAMVLDPVSAQEKKVPAVLNFKMKSIDAKDVDLAKYQGKVILIVNVASECGYTPQYKGLQALHAKYARDGLVVLGVPCTDFGRQEPGTNEQVARFCEQNYGVKFDLLAKVTIAGKDPAPLYLYLTDKGTNPKFGGPVKWNFTKFLIGRNGMIIARFEPDVEPDDPAILKAIEAALAQK
jgi:glutathione peroxidase